MPGPDTRRGFAAPLNARLAWGCALHDWAAIRPAVTEIWPGPFTPRLTANQEARLLPEYEQAPTEGAGDGLGSVARFEPRPQGHTKAALNVWRLGIHR